MLACPPGQLGQFLKMADGSARGQGEEVMPVPDAVRIFGPGGEALADHRLPFRITGNGVSGPLDLDIHLQPDRAQVVGHRDHVIEIAARDPLLQPHLGHRDLQADDPVAAQQRGQHDCSYPVLVDSPRAARGQR